MNCSRFETLLSEFMEGALDPRVQTAMSEHASTCQACSGLLREVEQVRNQLADFPIFPVAEGLLDEILDRTSGRIQKRSLWSDLIIPTVQPFLTQRFAFATALMFVFLSFMVNLLGPDFSAFTYDDLRPSNIVESADRLANRIYRNWVQFNDYRYRLFEEARLFKEDLFGRLDYHLITMLFKSYSDSLKEQQPAEAEQSEDDSN